jgi:hypothetical protein
MPKPEPAWFAHLHLRESLLVWLCGAQQRWESAALSRFGHRWRAEEIRHALRELQRSNHIQLMAFDRVTWAVQIRGRNAAQQARARAERKAAKAAA